MSGKIFLWYTDRNFFGEGGWGGENFPKKNFQVKFENLVLSGRFNQTPPLKRVSRDGTAGEQSDCNGKRPLDHVCNIISSKNYLLWVQT